MISAISIKARLKDHAIKTGKSMQEALTAYGLERTVYRISISPHMERFTLKGGIFLYALFEGEFARATRDIDLLAVNIPNSVEAMQRVFEEIFAIECDDALRYDLQTLHVKDITEFKKYHGVNVSINAFLDRTRVPVSIDIGFGDTVYPGRVKLDFPVLFDMKIPEVYAYSICSVIAEKFEAIVSLGDANSRYKDFYDICILARKYDIDGRELREAVKETFDHRTTGFEDIAAFDKDFAESSIHRSRWNAFLKKKKAMVNIRFEEAIDLIKILLNPIVESITEGAEYEATWDCKAGQWKH